MYRPLRNSPVPIFDLDTDPYRFRSSINFTDLPTLLSGRVKGLAMQGRLTLLAWKRGPLATHSIVFFDERLQSNHLLDLCYVSNSRRQVSIRMMLLTGIPSHLPMKDGVTKKKTTEIHSATEVQEQERYVPMFSPTQAGTSCQVLDMIRPYEGNVRDSLTVKVCKTSSPFAGS